jgi:hypothetical protein
MLRCGSPEPGALSFFLPVLLRMAREGGLVPFTTYLEFWTYRRMEQAGNVRWSVTWTESFEAFAPSISSFAISGNELGTRFLKIGNTSLYFPRRRKTM